MAHRNTGDQKQPHDWKVSLQQGMQLLLGSRDGILLHLAFQFLYLYIAGEELLRITVGRKVHKGASEISGESLKIYLPLACIRSCQQAQV